MGRKPHVRTIFPHTAGNNPTLLSFEDGDIIILLIQEERDGWLYGELEKNQQYVFDAPPLPVQPVYLEAILSLLFFLSGRVLMHLPLFIFSSPHITTTVYSI